MKLHIARVCFLGPLVLFACSERTGSHDPAPEPGQHEDELITTILSPGNDRNRHCPPTRSSVPAWGGWPSSPPLTSLAVASRR